MNELNHCVKLREISEVPVCFYRKYYKMSYTANQNY